MHHALREYLTQFHRCFQEELVPLVEDDIGQSLTPVLTKLLRIWECVEIERFVSSRREHVSRDATAIEVRERPVKTEPKLAPAPRRRGRPRKDEVSGPAPGKRLEQQATGMSLEAMLADLPTFCDVGTKRNSQGYKTTWIGYKLHLDVADGMVPISAIVTSASVHDSQLAIPLATMSAQRVTHLYDLMDAGYCSSILREHSRSMGHVPLIDHNPRGDEKKRFDPREAERYKERTTVERANARLKDDFGLHRINVRGHAKVTTHIMFAVLALTADQLLRWKPKAVARRLSAVMLR